MFEVELLYEQLKYNIRKEAYVTALNTLTENSYDIQEAKNDVNKSIEDIKSAVKIKKVNLLDKRRKGVTTAKQLLSKYSVTNKASTPYGLVKKEFVTFKTDNEIKNLYESAVKFINQFDPIVASDEEVKSFISDIGKNVQYKSLNTIFGEGKCSRRECVISKKEAKELTKQDIVESNEFLYNFSENANEYCIIRESCNTSGLSKDRKIASIYKEALMSIADARYYELMSTKLTLEFAQVDQVLNKVAHYNPRNIKDSKEVQDYIDFIYEYCV